MTLLPDHLGATLADELLKQSERDASITPMDAVLDAAQSGTFTDDHGFRFLARLWTLKRMMYYVYGGWAQGINLNEYPPPSPIFSASKLTTSRPTRCSFAMKCYGAAGRARKNNCSPILTRNLARPRAPARLRALANYPQNVRIAAPFLLPGALEEYELTGTAR